MIKKSYKFRIYPNEAQKQQLAHEFGCSRLIWNLCLDLRSKAYKEEKKHYNTKLLSQHINQLKKTEQYHWLNNVTAACLTQKLRDQEKAFTNFFKKRAKYPKFKKKHHAQSVRYQIDQRCVANYYRMDGDNRFLKLPNLGELKVKWSRMPQGIPKMATVSKTAAGDYYVSLSCEEETQPFEKTNCTGGVDVGIKDVVVTSDGDYAGAPKYSYQYAWALKKAQRKLARIKRVSGATSNRYQKQRVRIAKLHEKIANCRKDFLHKLTTWLIKTYDIICLEDLNVKGMMKNRKLSRAIADIGLFELKRQLLYKAEWYGKTVSIIDRWYPSSKTCSCCGEKKEVLKLSERVFRCEKCGQVMCRDLNAAKNIKQEGLNLLGFGAGNALCGAVQTLVA